MPCCRNARQRATVRHKRVSVVGWSPNTEETDQRGGRDMIWLNIDYEQRLRDAWRVSYSGMPANEKRIIQQMRKELPSRLKELRRLIMEGNAVIKEVKAG